MYRAGWSVSKLGKSFKKIFDQGVANNNVKIAATGIARSVSGHADGEPSFLEMVSIFTENAHAITLNKLLSAKPAPGKRADEQHVREKRIKGS